MKVLCVNNKPDKNTMDVGALKRLVEGESYTVIGITNSSVAGYILKEVKTCNMLGFKTSRFIPLSSIDEKEIVKERESELVTSS